MSCEPTDQELVIRLKRGDFTALAALDQRYRVRMIRLIAQMARSYEEAEDIYQEAILKVVSHIDSFDHRRSYHAWLHRVAKNQCIDNYRRNYHVEVDRNDDVLAAVAGSGRDPLDEATDRELQGEIQKAIDALPKRQRSVAKLRLLEGLGYQEIAKQIGGSVQAVKSLFSVARKTLQVKLRFYLSCFVLPWRGLRRRVDGSGVSASTATSISGFISLAAHLTVVTVLIYGSMEVTGENDTTESQVTNLVTLTYPGTVRSPLPTSEGSSRESPARQNLSLSRRSVHRKTPILEPRTLEAVCPAQASNVLNSSSLILTPKKMYIVVPESISAIISITPDEVFAATQLGIRINHRPGRAVIDRFTPRPNPGREIGSFVSQLSIPDEKIGNPRVIAGEKRFRMQASSHVISNAFRRLRAIRSAQEFDAYSLAQLRRVARSAGQHPLLISHCDPTDLRELLAESWTPIVMLRSLVGGTHPWVITAWDAEAGQIILTNPLERHTKRLSETPFIEAWQRGSSPSTCLLLAAQPLPDHALIFSSSQKHVSVVTDNSPRIWH